MIEIKVELDCVYEIGRRLQCLIDDILQKNVNQKYSWLRSAKTTIKEV